MSIENFHIHDSSKTRTGKFTLVQWYQLKILFEFHVFPQNLFLDPGSYQESKLHLTAISP